MGGCCLSKQQGGVGCLGDVAASASSRKSGCWGLLLP